MAKYVDGFVLVIPNDKGEEYKKMAEGGRDSWMKHGALAYYERQGDAGDGGEGGGIHGYGHALRHEADGLWWLPSRGRRIGELRFNIINFPWWLNFRNNLQD